MKILFAIAFGAMVVGLLRAILRVAGQDFVGDRKRFDCANCTAPNIEHIARSNGPFWISWVAALPHNAR